MKLELEIAIPTCEAPGPFVEKKTRSPARTLVRETGRPARYWA